LVKEQRGETGTERKWLLLINKLLFEETNKIEASEVNCNFKKIKKFALCSAERIYKM
jgi:hypothetical protein